MAFLYSGDVVSKVHNGLNSAGSSTADVLVVVIFGLYSVSSINSNSFEILYLSTFNFLNNVIIFLPAALHTQQCQC